MKKILIFLAIISFTIISCDKDESLNSNYKITKYAVFEFNPEIKVAVGGPAFTPAAVAKIDGAVIPFQVIGNVNTAVVGIYDVTYRAINEDGYPAEAVQKVIVYDPSATGLDVSGLIVDATRPARKGVITKVEGTNNIFFCTDFGLGGLFPMYFAMNGNNIVEISQVYPAGCTSVDLTYDPVTMRFTTFLNGPGLGYGYTFKYQ